ncbi:MAG: SLBB domain-containing protein [Ignavibacteriales bacterium]|nr:SLBB domain-containing protein [Ignavibacteriales bacterium]
MFDVNRWTLQNLCVILFAFSFVTTHAQERNQLKQQAESRLEEMTPEEIDARIRELGISREQAEARASELDINLSTYLRRVPPAQTIAPAVTVTVPTQPERDGDTVPSGLPRPVRHKESLKGQAGLPYFGYDIFLSIPPAFEPTAVGPVDLDYVIGPEDVLRVTIWGQVEFQNEMVVDRSGLIFIPTVGQVLVSGLSLEQLYQKLKKQMSRSYSGLLSQPPTVWLDVTLAKLRPKRVFIMGEVESPGGYTVSSYATVFSSLYSVGGPSLRGSLRVIRVIRSNKIIAQIDLYDYLTGAQNTNDLRVQSNDIIFVPVRGKTVTITGAIRRPAIYELKPEEHLISLLKYCGGLLPTAYVEKVQIERIRPFNERTGNVLEDRIVIDFSLGPLLKSTEDIALFDADEVQVPSVLDEMENYVLIRGPVWRPGRYDLNAVRTIRDLLAAAEGIQPKAYLPEALLSRLNDDRMTRRIIRFDLGKLLDQKNPDHQLEALDEVTVFSMEAVEVKERFITIRGEVKNPGRYSYRDGLTLRDLILEAGGFTEKTELKHAEVSRLQPSGLYGDSLAIILKPGLPSTLVEGALGATPSVHVIREKEEQFLLQHRDEVFIKPNPYFEPQQNVSVEGEVMHPGVYTIQHRVERLSDLIMRAGGLTKNAYLDGAEYYRGGKRLLLDFNKAYYRKEYVHNVILDGGDRIMIPRKPHTVLVTGEVNKSGLLSFIEGDAVSDYIQRAGELTDSASYALLTYPTGETRKVNFGLFRANPEVLDGSIIHVLKVPPEPAPETGVDLSTTIRDVFAVLTSAATLVFIIWQVSQ